MDPEMKDRIKRTRKTFLLVRVKFYSTIYGGKGAGDIETTSTGLLTTSFITKMTRVCFHPLLNTVLKMKQVKSKESLGDLKCTQRQVYIYVRVL